MQSNPNRLTSSLNKMGACFGVRGHSDLYMLPYGHKHQKRTSKNKTLRTHRTGK